MLLFALLIALTAGLFGICGGMLITRPRRRPTPRQACGLEMVAGTGCLCRRPFGHRGLHLVDPYEMFDAGFARPEF